jgi:hypothetical protein
MNGFLKEGNEENMDIKSGPPIVAPFGNVHQRLFIDLALCLPNHSSTLEKMEKLER